MFLSKRAHNIEHVFEFLDPKWSNPPPIAGIFYKLPIISAIQLKIKYLILMFTI